MRYLYGITDEEYKIVKDVNNITLGLGFTLEHRNLFVKDFVDLININSKTSFRINSIKYSNTVDKNILILGTKDSEYFTILELQKKYD